jgi:hypothetical protein
MSADRDPLSNRISTGTLYFYMQCHPAEPKVTPNSLPYERDLASRLLAAYETDTGKKESSYKGETRLHSKSLPRDAAPNTVDEMLPWPV